MGRYLSVTPVDQQRRQLGVRSYSRWYYSRSGVGVLARRNRLALNIHLKTCYSTCESSKSAFHHGKKRSAKSKKSLAWEGCYASDKPKISRALCARTFSYESLFLLALHFLKERPVLGLDRWYIQEKCGDMPMKFQMRRMTMNKLSPTGTQWTWEV